MNKLKKRMSRTLALALAVATLVLALSLSSCGKKISEVDVITSEHYTVSAGMVTYSLYDSYYYYVNYFGTELMKLYFGIDTSVSLKEQYSDDTKKTTWFDVFKTDALDGFCNALALCEAAYEDGVTLNEVDQKYIQSELDEIAEMAAENNMSMKEYIEFIYTDGVTEEDIKKSLEIYRLANKKRYKDFNDATVSETEINNIMDKEGDTYLKRDVLYFQLTLANEDAKNTVIKEYAEKLKSAATEADFRALAEEFLASDACVDTKQKVTSETLQNNVSEDEKTAVDEWMFASGTSVGSTYLYEGNTAYIVYMATSEAALDSSVTKDIYTILFSPDVYGDEAEAKANAIYEEWKNSGEDMKKFSELAAQYTTDYASVYSGGLYANVANGDLIDELNDWLFDENLEEGASAVIKTTYGYHIMVYTGEGEPAWKVPIIEEIKDNKVTSNIQYYAENYTVTIIEGNLKYVKGE